MNSVELHGRPKSADPPREGTSSWGPLLAVGVLAFAVRSVALVQTRSLPFHAAPIGDGRAYLAWATRIANGDWAGRSEGIFYQAPFYPYLLALLRRLAGPEGSLFAVRWLQIVVASIACAALVKIGERVHSRTAGLGAGIAMAIYAPAVTLDVQIAKESLALSLGVVLFACALTADASCKGSPWFAAGLALGVVALLRENALLLAAGGGLWLLFASRAPGVSAPVPARPLALAAWSAGLALVLLPLAVRNRVVGGEWVLTTAQAGPNFFIGNHEGASGSYVPLRAGRGDAQFERQDAVDLAQSAARRPLTATGVSRFWWNRGFEFWRRSPGAAVRLSLRKLRLALADVEISDVEADWIYARESSMLRATRRVGRFGTLAPLACFGFVCGGLSRRVRALSIAWLLVTLAGLAAFFVLGRYRVLALPPLFLGCGCAVARLLDPGFLGGHGRTRAYAVLGGGLAGCVAVVNFWPGAEPASARGAAEANLAVAYSLEGRFAEGEAAFRRALDADPRSFQALLGLGNLLRVLGRPHEASPWLERATELVPEDADARAELAAAHAAVRGSTARAASGEPESLDRDRRERAP